MLKLFAFLATTVIAPWLVGCSTSKYHSSDPSAIWAHAEFKDFEKGVTDAIAMIQKGKLAIPLHSDYTNKKLEAVLLKDYGIGRLDSRGWNNAYATGFNVAMQAAAKNKLGSEWWRRALKKAQVEVVPLPGP